MPSVANHIEAPPSDPPHLSDASQLWVFCAFLTHFQLLRLYSSNTDHREITEYSVLPFPLNMKANNHPPVAHAWIHPPQSKTIVAT